MAKVLEKRIKVSSDTQGIEDVKKGFQDLTDITKLLITKIATLATKIKQISDETDKLITYQRLLGTTFGENTESVTKFANALSKMTGVAESDVYKQVALFGQTANSLGLAAESAELYSRNLATLSSKLSMVYNVDYERASKALRDAAKGESSTLATLTGIIVKNRTLQDELYRLGINREVSSLNNAERAIMQYIAVSRQMQNADNATAQAVNSVAWQKKLLAEQVQRLAAAIGKVLYPVLQAILPVFNAILIVITTLFELLASLIGYKNELVETTSSISQGISDIGTSAAKTAKTLNTSLRSFDKLNNIKSPTDNTSGLGGGLSIDPSILNAFSDMNEELLNVKNKAQEIADSIMEWLGFSKDVNGEWEFSEVKLGTLVGLLVGAGGIVWAVNSVLGIIKAIQDIGGLAGVINGGMGLGTIIKIAGGAALIIFGILKIFQGIKELKMGEHFKGIMDILIGIAAVVAGIALIIGGPAGLTVALIAGIVLIVAEIIKNWDKIKGILQNAIKWIKEKFGIIGEYFAAPIEMAIEIFDGLYVGIKDIVDGIVKIFKGDFKSGITQVLKGVANVAIGALNAVIKGVNAMLTPLRAIIVVIGKVMGKNWTLEKISIPTIPKLATGGFPEDGLFYANHNELVGKFNNGKTAVANNEQISKGIEEASFQGMMKALTATGGSKQKIEITAEGDASGLLDFITFKQKAENRRIGL